MSKTAKDKDLAQDIELADKVIALIPSGRKASHRLYWIENVCIGYAERFVRDWRVAGALMEKYELISSVDWGHFAAAVIPKIQDGMSLHRAIIEACVEAPE